MPADILIVDDEEDIRELVSGILSDEGHATRLACNSDEALAAIEARRPQLVLLDIWLQGSRLDGLQLLEIVKQQHGITPEDNPKLCFLDSPRRASLIEPQTALERRMPCTLYADR